MSLGSYIVRVAGGLNKDISAAEQTVLEAARTVVEYIDSTVVTPIEEELEVFFEQIVPAEITALQPFVQEAFKELAVDLPALLTGGLASFWTAVAPALLLTATKAEAAGVAAAKPIVLAAVAAHIANTQPAVTAQ